MAETEAAIEMCPLSSPVTRDDTTVDVETYRLPRSAGWALEVVDHEAGTTVWEATVDTDETSLPNFHASAQYRGYPKLRGSTEGPIRFIAACIVKRLSGVG